MANESFVLGLAVICTLVVMWACKVLPAEHWQILASVPVAKDESGRWRGLNLTYYGLLTANAVVAAIAMIFILMTAVGVPLVGTLMIIITESAICLPAAKLVARIVERKDCTFTVSGAFFVGIVTLPGVVSLTSWSVGRPLGFTIPLPVTLAAAMVAYAFGKGLGRLACISFGCCYGKPLSLIHPAIRSVFERWHFVFFGKTKKIAYASGMEGEPVVPIQAVTSILYLSTGLLTALLFLRSHYIAAFAVSLIVTQGWRALSETLRADYRGGGKVSAYQVMGLFAIPYSLCVSLFIAAPPLPTPNVGAGIQSLWTPAVVLFLQGLWVAIFLFFGRSMVTGSEISFHVHYDKV